MKSNLGEKPPVHLGDPIIMVRYETPELAGKTRAAKIVKGPFIIDSGPHAGEWGVNLFFWMEDRSELDNQDPVLLEDVPTGEGVKTGMDWRMSVPYDPTGLTPRSWHIWGEAAGEE